MISEAYRALVALRDGDVRAVPSIDRWVSAFTDVQWVVQTDDGPVVTDAGRAACDEISRRLEAPEPRRRRRK